jgi:biopolymer transport protein TolR
MGIKSQSDDDLIADINITPFVDIILVVLIIFMVTATTIANQSIQINLPDASTGEATEQVSLGVTLLDSGEMLLDGEPTTGEALSTALQSYTDASADVVVLISADQMVAHGRVVWLMDLVRSNGIARFAFNIDKTTAIGPDPKTTATE